MHIIGTAGHVDHGKSSLVHALTGTDPDRWAEEQRRGMTLDLGFAHLAFDDGVEAGIIDVPGHERFLHNMLAGAAGMELVLLVVAANEGAMPQTFEHLAILDYLNARRAIVVLTKSDTLDGAGLERAGERLRDALRGTFAAGAPLCAVSVRSGAGLPALRAAIHAALRELPARATGAPAYMPVDRVFALAGHGTIVTGTLMQGRIATGDALVLTPPGRTVRVRSLHVFGSKRDSAAGGTRVAVNLPGVDTGEVARGAVLASAQFLAASAYACAFRAHAPARALLRRRMPVRAYLGAAEILGTLVFTHVPTDEGPTAATLYLRTPTVVVPHTPFVVRRVSPMDLLGGGAIVAAAATADETAAGDDPDGRAVLDAIVSAGLAGATATQVGAQANLDEALVQAALARLRAGGRVRALAKPPALIAADLAAGVYERAVERLRERQNERPWTLGVTSLALAQALSIAEPTLMRILATYVDDEQLVYRGGYYATIDFTPRLSPEQQAFFDHAFGNETAPLALEELRAHIKASPVPELARALETLLAREELTRVGDFVYRGAHLANIRARLEAELRGGGRLTVSEFRTLTGTSRKYAVPLLEFFDARGVTLRNGDYRTLRASSARKS
jgi:selenocysteine-specific elongation factor